MEFFLALFGSAFLIFIFAKERAGKSAHKERSKRYHDIDGVIINSPQETILRQQFVQDRWTAVELVADNLSYAFGENWREIFRQTDFCEGTINRFPLETHGFIDVWNAAFQIYLAKHGYRKLIGSPTINPLPSIRGINPEDDYVHEESKACAKRVCHEIEKNIQALHGDEYKLYCDAFKTGYYTWGHFIDSYRGTKGPRPW